MGMLNLIFPAIYNTSEASTKLLAKQFHLIEQEVGVQYTASYLQEIVDLLTTPQGTEFNPAQILRLETDQPGRWIVMLLDPAVDLGAVGFTYDLFLSGELESINPATDSDKFQQLITRIALRVGGSEFRINVDNVQRAITLFNAMELAVDTCNEAVDGEEIFIGALPSAPTVRALFFRPTPPVMGVATEEALDAL